MDARFWHQRWEKNEIAFHASEANPLLLKYFKALSLAKGRRVFLPLCGKTLDISWLLSNGYRVAGAELSQIAIEQLFKELGVEPKVTELGESYHYSEKNIDIFVGDIFDLSSERLGPVDAVYQDFRLLHVLSLPFQCQGTEFHKAPGKMEALWFAAEPCVSVLRYIKFQNFAHKYPRLFSRASTSARSASLYAIVSLLL